MDICRPHVYPQVWKTRVIHKSTALIHRLIHNPQNPQAYPHVYPQDYPQKRPQPVENPVENPEKSVENFFIHRVIHSLWITRRVCGHSALNRTPVVSLTLKRNLYYVNLNVKSYPLFSSKKYLTLSLSLLRQTCRVYTVSVSQQRKETQCLLAPNSPQ